jgi:NAD(P)-dependent dehydrogenase (short-subunit alcohol dehydrogenase family)
MAQAAAGRGGGRVQARVGGVRRQGPRGVAALAGRRGEPPPHSPDPRPPLPQAHGRGGREAGADCAPPRAAGGAQGAAGGALQGGGVGVWGGGSWGWGPARRQVPAGGRGAARAKFTQQLLRPAARPPLHPQPPDTPKAAVHVVRLDMRDLDAVRALPGSLPAEFKEVGGFCCGGGCARSRQAARPRRPGAAAAPAPLPCLGPPTPPPRARIPPPAQPLPIPPEVDILVNNAGLALGVSTVENQDEAVGGWVGGWGRRGRRGAGRAAGGAAEWPTAQLAPAPASDPLPLL